MQIRWTCFAAADVEAIVEYIKSFNPNAANRIARKIWDAVKILSDHPEMGRPGRVMGTRELVISNTPYIIPYRIKKNSLHILRVIHAARKWPDRF